MMGITSLESMTILEQMNYEIEMNKSFLYYLKVQLVIVNTKLFYYHTRSRNIQEIFKTSQENLMELIKVINICLLLNQIITAKSHNSSRLSSIRAMPKLLTKFITKQIEMQPFKMALETLKNQIEGIIEKCRKIKAKTSPEICEFCEEVIEENELACSQNHQLKRCAITNRLIELNCKNFCGECMVSVTTIDNLKNLFNNPKNFFCPFCDGHLTFSE